MKSDKQLDRIFKLLIGKSGQENIIIHKEKQIIIIENVIMNNFEITRPGINRYGHINISADFPEKIKIKKI
jgi:hypothetical protein